MTGQDGSDKVNFYHVAIIGPGAEHYYESAPFGGVQNTLVPTPLPDCIEVYRFVQPLTDADKAKMWAYANAQLGKGYNYIGVLTAGWIEVAGKPFCSELVWRICAAASRNLCDWMTCISPDDLAESPSLQKVS